MLVAEKVIVTRINTQLAVGPAEVFLENVAARNFIQADNFDEGVDTWEVEIESLVKEGVLGNAAINGETIWSGEVTREMHSGFDWNGPRVAP